MDNYMEDGTAIAASPHDRNVMATVGNIYISPAYWFQTAVTTDGGSTWRHDTVESQRRAHAVVFDLGNPSRVYLGGDSSYSNPMFKISTDLGQTWTESHSGLAGSVAAIATVSRSPSTLYCGTTQGLYKSTDAGASWSRTGSVTAVRAVVVDTLYTDTVYAGTGSGIYVTTDAGASWSPFSDGLTNTDVITLALRPGPNGLLFAGTNGGGLFRTVPLSGIRSGGAGPRLADAGMSLFPNPCRRFASLRLGPGFKGKIRVGVFDVAGRNVTDLESSVEPGTSDPTLDVRQLPEGVYLVRLEVAGASARQKLVVRH
jgi:photosystem II stability/assembly factor-like uncharacterized protein